MAKAKVNKKMAPTGLELPECPVCMEVMTAPIFQCQSGHSLCNSCTRSLLPPICPICRQPMTQMRNWQLEDLISKATVPCPNKASGCVFTMVAMDVEDHLKECIFREMACPHGLVFGRCSWSGKLKDMLEHFKERHPSNCYWNSDNDININNVSTSVDERYMYLMPQGKFLFIFTLKIDTCQKMVYWVVQHIGSKKAAKQYLYEINIISKQDDQRKVTYSDTCFNDAYDINEIFRQARCAIMPLNMLSHFIKDGKLSFRFNIRRSQAPFRNKEKGNFVKENKPANNGPHGAKVNGPKNTTHHQRAKSPGPVQSQKGFRGPHVNKNMKQ